MRIVVHVIPPSDYDKLQYGSRDKQPENLRKP